MEKKALFWEKRGDSTVKCLLCPHTCVISPGRRGICRVRENREGELTTLIYGEISSMADDPIEKKPLYHFHPGTSILSVGTVGCSFRCKFCQNYNISQDPDYPTQYLSPEDLVDAAKRSRSLGIAYTYTEPLIWYEYVIECCRLARQQGLKNVFVTNGYINREPLRELLPYADAFNVDLKSFREEFYRRVVGGKLHPVLDTIRDIAARDHVVLEVTTLVIPGYNDSDEEMESLTDFLASLRPDIPYHLSAYYPMYQFTAPATRPESLKRLKAIADKKLSYVYLGNVSGPGDTYCHNCGSLLVRRMGYRISIDKYRNGSCRNCGAAVPIVG
jgi:pyruvate formate lyase activating enzyme